MRPRKFDAGVMRAKILDAAIVVLQGKGYHECLTDEIAARAGIAKGTVYLYFKSKEEIYFSILLRFIDEMKGIVRAVSAGSAEPVARLRALITELDRFVTRHGTVLAAVRDETRPATGKFHARFHTAFHELLADMSAIFKTGAVTRAFKPFPPEYLSGLVFSWIMHRARVTSCRGDDAGKFTPDMMCDIILNGIVRKSAQGGK